MKSYTSRCLRVIAMPVLLANIKRMSRRISYLLLASAAREERTLLSRRVPHVSRSSRNVGFHGNIPLEFPHLPCDIQPCLPLQSSSSWSRRRQYTHMHRQRPNPFVVKILTSKPSALKILQTLFASTAPSKP